MPTPPDRNDEDDTGQAAEPPRITPLDGGVRVAADEVDHEETVEQRLKRLAAAEDHQEQRRGPLHGKL